MPFTVTCSCGKKLSAREEHIGKRAKCSQCGQTFLIARPPPNKPPSPPPEPAIAAPTTPLYDGRRVEHWLDVLASSNAEERRKAADVLAGVGPEAVAELATFVGRCESENVLVRHWAVVCIGQIGPAGKDALPSLFDRLNDEQPLVREKAAKTIEQIVPDARPFVPHLLGGLHDKDAERRAAAIELFRRNLQTAGISRFRFWACTCGRVYIKLDLDQRLRNLVDAPDQVSWEGKRTCRQCGAEYEDREIYAGKYDVPEPHWPKLRSKFGKQLSVPDDLLADAQEDAGYRISEHARSNDALPAISSLAPFSISLESPAALESEQGYALADVPQPAALHGVLGSKNALEEAAELVPGADVPRSGKYKCTSCGKKRLSSAPDASKSPARASVVMQFKAGKAFSECPQCGDLTEWEWLG